MSELTLSALPARLAIRCSRPPLPFGPRDDDVQDMCKRLGEAGVSTVFDLLDLDTDKRRELLALSEQQLEDVAAVCSRYPDINLSYEVGA